jgi:hypothetical protein
MRRFIAATLNTHLWYVPQPRRRPNPSAMVATLPIKQEEGWRLVTADARIIAEYVRTPQRRCLSD